MRKLFATLAILGLFFGTVGISQTSHAEPAQRLLSVSIPTSVKVGPSQYVTVLHSTHTSTVSAVQCAQFKRAFPTHAKDPSLCTLTSESTATITTTVPLSVLVQARGALPPDSQCGSCIGGGCTPVSPPWTMDDDYIIPGPLQSYAVEEHTHFHGDTCSNPVVDWQYCYPQYTTVGTSVSTTGCTHYPGSNYNTYARAQYWISQPGVGYTETQYEDDLYDLWQYNNFGNPYS